MSPQKDKKPEKTERTSAETAEDRGSAFGLNPYENSVTYRWNEATGEWEIINPASAIAYNYLYREDWD